MALCHQPRTVGTTQCVFLAAPSGCFPPAGASVSAPSKPLHVRSPHLDHLHHTSSPAEKLLLILQGPAQAFHPPWNVFLRNTQLLIRKDIWVSIFFGGDRRVVLTLERKLHSTSDNLHLCFFFHPVPITNEEADSAHQDENHIDFYY